MAFNKFRLWVILRLLLLSFLSLLVIIFIYDGNYYTSILVFLFFIYHIILLIRFVEISTRDLQRFIDSVRHSDFSVSFIDSNLGPTFSGLRESFTSIIGDFQRQRKESEEQHQYLQTILKQIGVGFISFDNDGKIELINPEAQRLLGGSNIIKIKQLNSLNPNFENALQSMKSNTNILLQIVNNDKISQLSLNANEFMIKSKRYKLVTLQDISGELERERMGNELEIARNIQRRLIPQNFPPIPGYDIKGICNPAKEVGGDYYDYSLPADEKIGLVIGDVSGKGVPASIYMTLSKGIFQSYAENNISPKEVLTSVNNSLNKLIEKGVFITMFYGILDYKTDELVFCRAGHNPLIYYDSETGSIINIRPAGLALGFSTASLFKDNLVEEKIRMKTGDYILLYTDGLTEAKNIEGEFYGEEKLLSVFSSNLQNCAEDLVKAIRTDLNNFVKDAEQYDDITIIAMKKVSLKKMK
jgi:serine phosphatase RsbU (regulator of sigma subunit)